jgi:hypothetical protein
VLVPVPLRPMNMYALPSLTTVEEWIEMAECSNAACAKAIRSIELKTDGT